MEFSLNVLQRQELLRFSFLEIEDNEIIEECLIVILDDELAVHQSSEDGLSFVYLTVQQLPVANNCLSQ